MKKITKSMTTMTMKSNIECLKESLGNERNKL